MLKLLLKFSNLLGVVLLQIIDLGFVLEYLFVELLLELANLIMSIAYLLVHLLHGFSHSLCLAVILAVLSLKLLVFDHHLAHLLSHLSVLQEMTY